MPEEKQSVSSFESGLEELETVVKQLEKGDLPLERSIELFEKGMGLSEQCRLAHGFHWGAFGWRSGEAQRELLLQDQRESRAGMFARHIAGVASPSETAARRRIETKPYSGGFDGEA